MRLAVLVTHPVQYFAPVFRELAQQPDLEVKVFFGCNHGVIPSQDPNFGVVFKWDCQPTVGFEHHFLSTSSLVNLQGLAGVRLATKAAVAISRYKPDAVLIFAYSPAFITTSTLLLHILGHKLMLRAETTDEALTRSCFKDKIRQFILSCYYRQFTHFFPIGTNSINHYCRMGVDKSRLTVVHYAIDTDFFQKQVDYWLPQREYLRHKAGIGQQDYVLLYCGKMFRAKNPLVIPEAIGMRSPVERGKIWLLAVGDGELREQFERIAKAQLGERAIFVGFKNQSELGQYYAMADALILPSQSGETWGLVVNEALQFGLKVIVSDKVGSAKDLITDDNKGWIFHSGNVGELSKMISEAIMVTKWSSANWETLPHPKKLAEAVYLKVRVYD
ncbi:glycosyltransferase family 4 protein [Aetokthonos hydrillicola Thurmond2011]|jgi:glycosyltransferase involved in cell wall biosynthesis|uniref:Glycosyltransferase family 4 protein n=1 Tax=Aetokthonos hydrillicola Thurmond2011 TaxID=2712845 RepID=A0AAP5MCG0_9CYAN|nr:glycosyltransferase family 4 protein [Aetokthonos hydrillicola]MBO3460278.1 glycosyltransferase family 4 protein [Aetokthonos hydrillicola CCALA 1050]MBW4587624.1 glycosyltransferase family 4 protein [Aetokthonos hydrillicola CCALA 1050]MDR9897994.1 glycosyltransferase family 4 protein [Aetokthonos hydrillicola Thurmond2011]